MNTTTIPEQRRQQFWTKVDTESDPEGCWLWTGALNAGGRGRFTVAGVTRYAYVWALVLTGTDVPSKTPVRHLCGNPACCRPDHLSAKGGQRENNLDTVEHGQHPTAKLDNRRVREMRHRYAKERPPLRELAEEHGVGDSAISAALTGRTWPRAGGPLCPSRKRRESEG